MNELSEADKRLLELAALEVSWSMVCSEFESAYGSTGALARRIIELDHEELLTISGPHPVPSAEELAAEAQAKREEAGDDVWFSDWAVLTTPRGMRLVDDRLGRQ